MKDKIIQWFSKFKIINTEEYKQLLKSDIELKACNNQTANLKDTIKYWEAQHKVNREYIQGKKDIIKSADAKIARLERKLNSLQESNIEKQLNNAHPKGNISYTGRPLPFGKKNVDFPINILITPNDFNIIKDLKRWKLYQTGEKHETLIPKIYKKIKQYYYKYDFDKNTWGTNELWEFTFESMAKLKIKKGIDCDSWSHFQMSYYVAAGLKEAFGRVVVGNCEYGGHSTIYIYSLEDNQWHHLNSTYGQFSRMSKVSKYPTHEDARNGKDKIGITKVWFSFNRLHSWYKFGKDIPKELKIK